MVTNPNISLPQKKKNPFSSFESGIFRGVTAYKSATADIKEGFISGVVDKKLLKALSQNSDELKANIGSRYEQLNDSYDPEMTIRGTKLLIEDTPAITGVLAWSEQNFRRDSTNFTRYNALTSDIFPDVDQWRTDNRVTLTAGAAPIFGYQNGDEEGLTDNYIISDIEYDNASISPGTRDWDLLEKTDGIFLNLEWSRDNLAVESYLTFSDAETLIQNTQFDVRYQAVTPEGRRTDGAFRTNGINSRI